ncbi:hypothetical protein GCM10023322_11350 [Rugosimonospora acidiphila]|uniref:Uncharacterized protein n=1 Tax=Rugosimonospora acidiphila TaxID=556531 RepID=A0ABP9RLC1_9ACTN
MSHSVRRVGPVGEMRQAWASVPDEAAVSLGTSLPAGVPVAGGGRVAVVVPALPVVRVPAGTSVAARAGAPNGGERGGRRAIDRGSRSAARPRRALPDILIDQR